MKLLGYCLNFSIGAFIKQIVTTMRDKSARILFYTQQVPMSNIGQLMQMPHFNSE